MKDLLPSTITDALVAGPDYPFDYASVHVLMSRKWPVLFSLYPVVPLAVGIDKELMPIACSELGLTRRKFRLFMGKWTHNFRYHEALRISPYRFNIMERPVLRSNGDRRQTGNVYAIPTDPSVL